jgi:hypothetical protein
MPSPIWFLLLGYCFTVLVEGPVLWWGLHSQYSNREKLFAVLWLTACTYPIVVLVLPQLISVTANRATYLMVAETFAPAAECALFYLAFHRRVPAVHLRDYAAIIIANMLSFAFGEVSRIWLGF